MSEEGISAFQLRWSCLHSPDRHLSGEVEEWTQLRIVHLLQSGPNI
jgi:hypothetical protein